MADTMKRWTCARCESFRFTTPEVNVRVCQECGKEYWWVGPQWWGQDVPCVGVAGYSDRKGG